MFGHSQAIVAAKTFPMILVAILMVACSSAPQRSPGRAGGYYLNDGPPKGVTQAEIDAIREPIPKLERLVPGTLRPYTAMGRSFEPRDRVAPYRATGIASWYGTRYHGRPTATGETYDLMKVTAAHPILPLPSYVRVRNLENGKSLIVRVNDRGPFVDGRLIDLSYAAAAKLGLTSKGSALVEVEQIIP